MDSHQKQVLLNMLWDSLKRVPGQPDKRKTGWGSKTKIGLLACVQRVLDDPEIVDPTK